MTDQIVQKVPEGTGDAEKVTLSTEEYKTLVEGRALDAQAKANMSQELIDLRKKNQILESSTAHPEEISKVVEAEINKRETEAFQKTQERILAEWLGSHPELSPDNDKDGSKFAAFKKALGRMNLLEVKTEYDYNQVLNDALRLTEQVSTTQPSSFSGSVPRGPAHIPGSNPANSQLSPQEIKLVTQNFGGNVEKYLQVRTKRPEYIDEILKWIK